MKPPALAAGHAGPAEEAPPCSLVYGSRFQEVDPGLTPLARVKLRRASVRDSGGGVAARAGQIWMTGRSKREPGLTPPVLGVAPGFIVFGVPPGLGVVLLPGVGAPPRGADFIAVAPRDNCALLYFCRELGESG